MATTTTEPLREPHQVIYHVGQDMMIEDVETVVERLLTHGFKVVDYDLDHEFDFGTKERPDLKKEVAILIIEEQKGPETFGVRHVLEFAAHNPYENGLGAKLGEFSPTKNTLYFHRN